MRIVGVHSSKENDGLDKFSMKNLGDIVILAGSNGSGKTRLLRLIENYIACLKNGDSSDRLSIQIELNKKTVDLDYASVSKIKIIDYSFYDAQLQSPEKFPPYVIHKAKEHLRKCDIRETALNSLLFIHDVAKGYSPEYLDKAEFMQFCEYANKFGLKVTRDEKDNPLLFDRKICSAALSPGQQYLLRMTVALYHNDFDDSGILFMDEPETHLHPDALVDLVCEQRKKFPNIQIWIATHSLALISCLALNLEYRSSVFHMEGGKIKRFGSDSEGLVSGLLGGEQNRFLLQQLLVSAEAFACNQFAVECMFAPQPEPSKGAIKDPQAEMAIERVRKPAAKVLDYGAGQGRLLQELYKCNEEATCQMEYYAYDLYDSYSKQCKEVMKSYGKSELNYFNNFPKIAQKLANSIDCVFLINVLHEIPPDKWVKLFEDISTVLNIDGEVVIVEKEELTYGEHPYDNGFLVLTEGSLDSMFPSPETRSLASFSRHCSRPVIRFVLPKSLLNIDRSSIIATLNSIHDEAKKKISEIKLSQAELDNKSKFKKGIRLAFWTHQFANAALNLETMQK